MWNNENWNNMFFRKPPYRLAAGPSNCPFGFGEDEASIAPALAVEGFGCCETCSVGGQQIRLKSLCEIWECIVDDWMSQAVLGVVTN